MRIHKFILSGFLALLFFTSCSSTAHLNRQGAARIKDYKITHKDIPPAFDNFRIIFISDLHYKSTLQEKGLHKLMNQLRSLRGDMILMGGDYHEGVQYIRPLFDSLREVHPPYGIIGVLGNNDYEAGYGEIMESARENQIRILEHTSDTIRKEESCIIIAGVRNPFDKKKNGISPDVLLSDSDFVILLTHTPDYAEYAEIRHSDLILAGHTHGGQITLFGYAPVTASAYGQRFRSGMKRNKNNIPVIITNGIGTSRKRLRLFAPSEIVRITLHPEK